MLCTGLAKGPEAPPAVQATQEGASERPESVRWRPGKAHDIAMSPNSKWLAVSFGDTVRLYSTSVLFARKCSDSMKEAEVSSPMSPPLAMAPAMHTVATLSVASIAGGAGVQFFALAESHSFVRAIRPACLCCPQPQVLR